HVRDLLPYVLAVRLYFKVHASSQYAGNVSGWLQPPATSGPEPTTAWDIRDDYRCRGPQKRRGAEEQQRAEHGCDGGGNPRKIAGRFWAAARALVSSGSRHVWGRLYVNRLIELVYNDLVFSRHLRPVACVD